MKRNIQDHLFDLFGNLSFRRWTLVIPLANFLDELLHFSTNQIAGKRRAALGFIGSRTLKTITFLFIFSLLCASGKVFGLAGSSHGLSSPGEIKQPRSISGIVLDETGQPIIGASIKEKGTTKGTVTDVKGQFTLNAGENSLLEISYIGYVTQIVKVGSSGTLRISMKADEQSLQEVVVTGFGLSQKKVTMTGAISTIGSKDIARSSAPTASGALVAKVPGLNFRQTDGRPGSSVNLRIRNMGDPLYVIDGIQSDAGQFNNIDFNDIESVAVLKDASASIYGVRAANGVVVVTTKKGNKNAQNTVSVSTYYGRQDNFKFTDPADAKTYVKNYVQAETLRGGNRTYSKEEYEKWMAGTEKGYQGFDWLDYIWISAPQNYINANVSGGSEKTSYYISVGNLNQDATIVNYGGFKRTNAQMNIESQINKRLKIGARMNGRIEKRENPGVPGGDDYWLPRFAVLRNTPVKGPYANDNPLYPQKSSDDVQTNFAILNYDLSGRMTDTWRVMQLQANGEYQIMDGLKAKVLGGYYFANRKFENQEYTYKLYRYDAATDTYPVDYTMSDPYRERINGYVEEMTSNIQLAYDKAFGRHSLSAVAGMETIQRRDPNNQLISRPVANNLHLINDVKEIRSYNDNGENPQARIGWMGRVNYDYANKYLLELSGRYDGSWKFPPNDRWGFFPSASVGWRISEEKFWKDHKIKDVISDLKLRASYGLVGDDNTPDYNAFDYMSGYNYKSGGYVIDGAYVVGTAPRGLPVTTLSWIKAKIFDAGFDVSFLNNRLTAQLDYFRRLRTGLPASRYDVLLPSELGFDLPKENLNSDLHKGIDGAIRWSDKINDLNYSIGASFTYSRFYDWEQYDNRKSNSWDVYRNSINHRFGYINWGLEAIGQFQSWEEIANYPIDNDHEGNRTLRPGDIKYKDVNGDKVINSMDERPIGYRQDQTPILNMGLNFAFNWKNIDLAFDFSGSALSTYNQRHEQAVPFQNNGNSPQFVLEDAWHLSDIWDANSEIIPGKYPMAMFNRSGHSNYWGSTFWKHNVRYMKLRNLELGYNVPKNVLSKVGVSGLRVYVSGTNLFAITNVKGADPEQQDENGLGYPTMRMYNFGVNLKF
ncbi:SusC/RagA family TonB-linked outer membrane protein [Pararcticibacter amylolyticus]|uniref:SusC/RagA family protein n=1 Tax=Pararcticibacter amylolyticus TaxID=2173175 RepID=A0A2U2PLH4_9SPHI|nr:TonB-dependent receptor [Pararcticibacter amylolyticus]PWG82255.1 SusC/RagA family protein [Pararcticibacter amylolyticus]